MTYPNADLVAEARSWLGVRWAHQGRSREGVDCVGLPIMCAKKLRGLEVPAPDYARETVDDTMLRMCRRHLLEISSEGMRPGDVVVMAFGDQRHMGLIGDYPGGGLSLIHAYLPNRKVVEARLDETWAARIVAVFRI